MPKNPLTGLVEKYYEPEEDGKEKMEEESSSTTPIQQIPPSRVDLHPGCYVNPHSFREFVFVHNPNLMWLAANNFDAPLLALDVQAHLAVKFLTGQRPMPTLAQMKADNHQQALLEMSQPMIRHWMDTNYYNAVQKWLAETERKVYYIVAKGNRCSRCDYPEEWTAAYRQTLEWELHLLARIMQAELPVYLIASASPLKQLLRSHINLNENPSQNL